MKKRLLIAAVAATMSVAATADISITGDAYVSFASQETGHLAHNALADNNNDDQRVRIKIVGSAGDTKVVALIDSGSATHVDQIENSDHANSVDTDSLHMDSLYLTTKIGPVDIKAGDYWGTIGLGAHSMEAPKKNAISISTKVSNDWKVGVFTANGSAAGGSESTNVNVSGKIGPVEVSAVHNPDNFTDISAKATFGGIFVAVEQWNDQASTDNDTTLIHIGGKVAGFKWDIAQIDNDSGAFTSSVAASAVAVGEILPNGDTATAAIDVGETLPNGDTATADTTTADTTIAAIGDIFVNPAVIDDPHSTGKFAPLGSMLIGTGARDHTATAVANVTDFTKILAVAVSTEVIGNTVKVIYTKSTLGDRDKITGTELIISRPLTNGSTLTANIGKISGVAGYTARHFSSIKGNATNTGLRLDVKF